MKKKFKGIIIENIKTITFALIIAVLIRSILFQPFYIPSSSMEPTLLVGDRIFVNKYEYGYSRHSFPFSPHFSEKRFFFKEPKRGDLVVFKTPLDNRTDYIKRLIGLPGETVQFIDGDLFINNEKIKTDKTNIDLDIRCGAFNFKTEIYKEYLPNGVSYNVSYNITNSMRYTDKYIVPINHYFFLGDNRDCSKDSRFLSSVGYVNKINLVGKASMIFFSNDTIISPLLKFWNIKDSIRLKRFFKKI
tara:strand:- start:639 stop:1376 length:738 start_codon:yes stop_codon:yes gene_type:complete